MRVLYPIEGEGGGAVTHVLTLARELMKRKIQTYIVFLTLGPCVGIARNLGLSHILMPCKFFPDVTVVWKLSKIIQLEKIDIVHTHTVRGNFYGRIATLVSRRHTISVTTVHSFLIDELGGSTNLRLKQKLLHKREVCTCKFVDQFISVSRNLGGKLLEDGIPATKVKVITHGIPIPGKADIISSHNTINTIRGEYNINENETVVGIIGRLVPVKNHRLFLMAAEKVLRTIPNVKFLIVGDGHMRYYLKQLARDLNVSDSVIFSGWRNDIEECIKAIDILVLCSTTESQGLVILEAMSFLKPVIATDVNEIGDTVIDGETGLLIPPNDLNALAEAILKLIYNKDLAGKLGEQGRSLVEKEYSLEKMINEIANLYRSLYQGNRGPLGRGQRLLKRLFA